MKKRLLSILLAVSMLLTVSLSAFAANFTDVTDENMKKAVQMLNSLGVISTAETFNPSGTLTRAMFCAMAVPLSGITDIDQYKTYTLFPDVRSNHWAMGYVNAAVKLKLFAPLPDGTFAPDRPITYNEAVTILVKMLDYSEADVGYSWPKNFLSKANAIGLTKGIPVTENLNRGQGALLFYNLLYTPVKESKENGGGNFIEGKFGAEQVSDAIITEVNVYSKGKLGIRTAEGKFYPTRSETDKSLVDCRVELLLDGAKYVLGIEPHKQTFNTITVNSARPGVILDTFNRELDVSASTQIVYYGSVESYSAVYEKIGRRDTLKIAYTTSGAIDYLVWAQNDVINVNNVIILDISAVDDDGNFGILVDGENGFYPTRVRIDDEMLGRRVDLAVNNRGEVVRVEPLSQDVTTLTANVVSSVGISATSGTNLLIPDGTRVYSDGAALTYAGAYNSMSSGDTLRVFYKRNGTLDYIVWTKSGSDIANSVYISIYYPGRNNVTKFNELTFTPEATLQAARFRAGDRITLLVSPTGVVSAVFAGTAGTASGYMTTEKTVVLRNGLALTVSQPDPDDPIMGTVIVYGDENGNWVIE